MPTPEFEPFVFTKKTVLMQRAADLARAGYTHWVGGVTTLDKLQALADKFADRYRIDRDKSNAYKATQRGEAVARLLSWCDEKSPRVHWVLMLKPEKAKTDDGTIKRRGGGVVLDQSEKWRDLTTAGGRLTLTGYELVRETKEGKAAPAWTWRYSKTRLDDLRSQIINAIRNKADAELAILIRDTWATPGFAGARKQVKDIELLIKAEWKRASRKADSLKLPEHLGYLRRLPDVGCKLSTLKRRLVLAENRRQKKVEEKAPAPTQPAVLSEERQAEIIASLQFKRQS
ncbi:hypothetical protein LH425_15105 [Laribacter hongkongensis]|uniref:hypothetical protein n=1 Tax=Laribacter hongkongensis TaxID=168471 RepID=UPI001EFE0BA6|nr:hypothetical protein [Laribacter hongkongensis]MCG9066316.1 hypothetical protein [Laribacter hongkongensis]